MPERHDLILIGMGSGGLVAAEFATHIGVRPVVVERARIGGDCLWTGCVPSKALLAAGRVAHTMRGAGEFGITPVDPDVDLPAVWRRIRAVQQRIAATDDSAERYEALGVRIISGSARLTGPTTVAVDGTEIESRHILICTGSRPAVPPIDGLAEAGYATSETLFELDDPPASFVVIGGGPIGVEMAQGMNRLGIEVALLEKGPRLLPRDEPELAEIVTRRLRDEGVDVQTGVRIDRVSVADGVKEVHGTVAGRPRGWRARELLVAVGRTPNLDGLGVEEVGVRVSRHGIETDDRLRTSVPSIYAAGDVAGRNLFTHAAGYEAVMAVRDMFFPGKGKADEPVPWCTFTDPELAHAGMTTAEAIAAHGDDDVEVHRMTLDHSDRARADGSDDGAIVLVTAKDKLVGAHIAAAAAGEMIHECALAIRGGMKLRDLAAMVHVYPTLSTSIGMLAAEAQYDRAKRLRWLVRK
jgi:pyruvate/2-oxoglutarate dehydrogenase complex dihydrolipoamide dehydrogenase (E3) component